MIGLLIVNLVKFHAEPNKVIDLDDLLHNGKTVVPLYPYNPSFLDPLEVTPISLPSNNPRDISIWLLNTTSSKEPYRYGAFDFGNNGDGSLILFTNTTALHAEPIFLREYQNWKLREWGKSTASIKVNMYPFPPTSDMTQTLGLITGITLGITLAAGMALIPGQAVTFPVRERQVKAMHQQVISGVSILAYWISNLLHEMTLMLVITICELIFIQVFNA